MYFDSKTNKHITDSIVYLDFDSYNSNKYLILISAHFDYRLVNTPLI